MNKKFEVFASLKLHFKVAIKCDTILEFLFFDLVTCFKVLKFQSHASQPVIFVKQQ